jgi:hypothetical protein
MMGKVLSRKGGTGSRVKRKAIGEQGKPQTGDKLLSLFDSAQRRENCYFEVSACKLIEKFSTSTNFQGTNPDLDLPA